MPTAEEIASFKAYLAEHGVEEAMSVAVDRVMKERPPDPVAAIGRILCGIDAAAPAATPTELTASGAARPSSEPATKELQELRAKMDALLAPLQQAVEAEAAGAAHATKLPAGLKDFKPLAAEPEIEAASAKLHELELALVKAPSSETARSELRAAAATLEEVTAAKIKERAASLLEVQNCFHPDSKCTKSGQSPIVGFRYHWEEKDRYGDATHHNLCEAEFAKLPDEEKAKYEKIAPPCSKSLQECEAAIADGNHDFEIIYDGVHRVIESGERDGLARFRTAVGALGGAATDKAVQRDEAAEPTTLLADAALAKPAFDQLASCVAWATGAKLELLLLGDRDRHGREVTSLKKVSRIIEKAQLRPGARRGKTEKCCDVVRAMLVCKDMATVARIAEALVALHAAGVIEVGRTQRAAPSAPPFATRVPSSQVVRTKDRFGFPSAGGWRDLMVNLIVFDGAAGGGVRHVCELQIAHEMMLTARKGLPGVRRRGPPRHCRARALCRRSRVPPPCCPRRSTRSTRSCATRWRSSSRAGSRASCGARRCARCAPLSGPTRRH